jgi:uncharacterized membrane protein YkvA (DUF1232 family)
MRPSIPTPTDDPLPWPGPGRTRSISTPLRPGAVAEFDQLLHELNPDAARVSAERLEGLCHWLASLPSAVARDVLDRRVRRIDEMRAMRADPDWDLDEATSARIAKLLAYVDRDDDLIPDHEALLGMLDDVLLLELAWPAFVAEMDEYLDFSAYRVAEEPPGDGSARRAAWVRDRVAEVALWRHHQRVNAGRYTARGLAVEPFHVGG